MENQKNLGKPKIPKVSGPSERVWIFGILVSAEGTTKPKNQKFKNLSEGPLIFWFSYGLLDVLTEIQKRNPKDTGFVCFSPETEQENQKNTCFFDFQLKSKKHVTF